MGRCRKVADDEVDIRGILKTLRYSLENGVGIDVQPRSFGTERDRAGRWLVVRMTGAIGIAVGPGNGPRKATCGCEARASNISIEATAASSIPWRIPSNSTAQRAMTAA
jgi:hypothetical protein